MIIVNSYLLRNVRFSVSVMILLVLIVVAYIIRFFVYVQFKLLREKLRLSVIPQAPHDNWWDGHKKTVDKAKRENRFLELFVGWVETYGSTIVFWLALRPNIFTTDAAILNQVSTDLRFFTKSNNLKNRSFYGHEIVGLNSILSGGGEVWAKKRKKMSRYFAKTNMSQLFEVCKPHMERHQVVRLQGLVGEGRMVDLHRQLAIIFTSYIQVMGLRHFSDPETIATNVQEMLAMIQTDPKRDFARFANKFFNFSESARVDHMIGTINDMRVEITNIVEEKDIEMGSNEMTLAPTDILGHLIVANRAGSKSRRAVVENSVSDVMTLVLVMDNMVEQLASMFIFLKECPDVQNKMFKELRENPITDLKSMDELKYTEKCLLESLRMGPALLRGLRMFQPTKKKRTVGPFYIERKSISVFYSEYVMHYNKTTWTDPYKFDPERWSEGFTPAPYTYLPFFAGPRGCLGKHMAMMMMKLTLSALARNFTVSQRFDKENPPVINQALAAMRIKNKVTCFIEPVRV